MHRYDYSFLKKQIPGNIVGLAEIPKGSPDVACMPYARRARRASERRRSTASRRMSAS